MCIVLFSGVLVMLRAVGEKRKIFFDVKTIFPGTSIHLLKLDTYVVIQKQIYFVTYGMHVHHVNFTIPYVFKFNIYKIIICSALYLKLVGI